MTHLINKIVSNFKPSQIQGAYEPRQLARENRAESDGVRNVATELSIVAEAQILERAGKYEDAISKLHQFNRHNSSTLMANFLEINLGRLYYRLNLVTQARAYFEQAIINSKEPDAQRLIAARHIFAVHPYSEDGIEILQEISPNSPHYKQAKRLLALNLTPAGYYQMFNANSNRSLGDSEILARSIYHKIANEISLLQDISYEIIAASRDEADTFADIIESIKLISDGIRMRREAEKSKVKIIPSDDYHKIIEIISQTAHDISDFVGNQLAILEEDIRYTLEELPEQNRSRAELQELLHQVKMTQQALNDLKSINEGIHLKRTHFPIKQLFAKWAKNPSLRNATISLDIQNGESLFYGDQQKIKSFLGELVENSLKHNRDQADLSIRISSTNQVNPPRIHTQNVPGEQSYLVITFSDNGRGIPPDKKEWIFLPLTTSSLEGSGLGLFIIKRTLRWMDGYIIENGFRGVNFDIYIPYKEK